MTYTTPLLEHLFSDQVRLERWAWIETQVLRAQHDLEPDTYPAEWVEQAQTQRVPSVQEWRVEETLTGHEYVAFLRAWGLGHIHIGLTSSDVIDTAQATILRDVTGVILTAAIGLRDVLADRAQAERTTIRAARTHGQPAVIDLAGHAWADLAFQMDRHQRRLQRARAEISVAKISGPSGSYHTVSPQVEATVAARVGLAPPDSATQIYARDSLAQWAAVLAGVVSTCEQVGMLIRLGSVVGEYQETFGAKYEGSSAMPHKRNPSRSERLSGLGRLARAAVAPIMEGQVQWWERDLAHSSVERELVARLAGYAGYALGLATALVDTVKVNRIMMNSTIELEPGLASHANMTAAQLRGEPYDVARQTARDTQGWQPGIYDHGPRLLEMYRRLERLGARPEEA